MIDLNKIKGSTKFSQAECIKMGVKAIRAHHIFNGKGKPPTLPELVKIATHLECKVNELPFLTDRERMMLS